MPPPAGAERMDPSSVSQSVLALAGLAMFTPIGKTSVKLRLVTGKRPLLSIVNTSLLTLPGPMVLGWNSLAKLGGELAEMPANTD